MGITLNNMANGGATNITLNVVTSYDIISTTAYARTKIPGANAPDLDTDTPLAEPTLYRIAAHITNAQKATLEAFKGERNRQCKLTDGQLSNKNVRPVKVSFSANVGDNTRPWVVTVEVEAEDH